jgi:hypothetical protein
VSVCLGADRVDGAGENQVVVCHVILSLAVLCGCTQPPHNSSRDACPPSSFLMPRPAGGVATSLRHTSEFIRPEGAQPGDVLVLTKPLGTQVRSLE